jgi:hypothetical protein
MQHQQFMETGFPQPGGQGQPVMITHDVYYPNAADPIHGVVQGWTTALGGKPVAVVTQRSTYGHEVDSGVGFLRFGMPSQTYDVNSWMAGASAIQYTFNWFYVDPNQIGYYESGLLPIRPSNVDPNLPTWGDGRSPWTGWLDFNSHVHQVGSPTGYITSWNNKGAPQFSAADDKYDWGPVQRVQSLNQEIQKQFTLNGGHITRANLVTAMETAAAVDLDGRQVLPLLLQYLGYGTATPRAEPAGVQAMLDSLKNWLDDGALRKKAAAGNAQYADAAAMAIMDELTAHLDRALFDPVFAAGGVHQIDGLDAGYNQLSMDFVESPNGGGSHHGSSYASGFQGYDWRLLRQLLGLSVATPFSATTTSHVCGSGGLADCGTAVDIALNNTYSALFAANGNSSNVAGWTQDTQTKSAAVNMPVYDDIHFTAVGIVGQPAIDWQNRPTFQQVVEFPLGGLASNVPEAPLAPLLPLAALSTFAAAVVGRRMRRRPVPRA